MPLYFDVHNKIEGLTKESAEEAHQCDERQGPRAAVAEADAGQEDLAAVAGDAQGGRARAYSPGSCSSACTTTAAPSASSTDAAGADGRASKAKSQASSMSTR